MDTFMDKLAQKLTAQEMIKANMAADAEEMNKLKEKNREYAECLEQMQKLVDSGVIKINEAQKTTEVQMNAEVKAVLEELKAQLAGQPEALESVKTLINDVKCMTADLDGTLKEKTGDLEAALSEKTGIVNESIHKECVKVYRNVQAVVVEENEKQSESLAATVNGLRGKLNAILGVSIAALILALGSVVIQVLNLLNFKFF